MASRRNTEPQDVTPRRRPATTPDGRESQLIAAAVDLAEKQISDGTASAQVITHFLKLGSSRERLEQQRVELENELLVAKTEAMASAKNMEAMYTKALNALRGYQGQEPMPADDVYED